LEVKASQTKQQRGNFSSWQELHDHAATEMGQNMFVLVSICLHSVSVTHVTEKNLGGSDAQASAELTEHDADSAPALHCKQGCICICLAAS